MCFFFQAEDGIRDTSVTGVQTCALPISITSKKVMDATAAPWLKYGGTPKLGWMLGSVQIDPFAANKVMYEIGRASCRERVEIAVGAVCVGRRRRDMGWTARAQTGVVRMG